MSKSLNDLIRAGVAYLNKAGWQIYKLEVLTVVERAKDWKECVIKTNTVGDFTKKQEHEIILLIIRDKKKEKYICEIKSLEKI